MTDEPDYEHAIICACGHGPEHHADKKYRQLTSTRKSYWLRLCRGHRGYSTGRGETPCRCDVYRPIKAKDYVYTATGRSKR